MVNDVSYKTLVIEDEKMARNELINALKEDGHFKVVGEAANVSQAYDLIKSTPAEVLFLDIGLPGGNAFYLLSELKKNGVDIPLTIIVTANTEYEYAKKILNEYSHEVLYILNKPFWSSWIQHCEDILDSLLAKQQAGRKIMYLDKDVFINIGSGRQSYIVNPDDIVFVKTGIKGSGKTFVTLKSNKTIECSLSLNQLIQQLPPVFFQINRFEAINLKAISLIDYSTREVFLINGQVCSIGSAFYKSFLEVTGAN